MRNGECGTGAERQVAKPRVAAGRLRTSLILYINPPPPSLQPPRPPHSGPLSTQCPLKELPLQQRLGSHCFLMNKMNFLFMRCVRCITSFSISSSLNHVLPAVPSVSMRLACELIRSQKLAAINHQGTNAPLGRHGHFGQISKQGTLFVLRLGFTHYHRCPCQLPIVVSMSTSPFLVL